MRFDGAKVLLTGTFDAFTIEQAASALREQGAEVVSRFAPDVAVVFAGANPDAVVDTARELGLVIRDEVALKAAVAGEAPPAPRVSDYDDVPFFDEEAEADMSGVPEEWFGGASDARFNEAPVQGGDVPQSGAPRSSFEKGSRVKIIGGTSGVGVTGRIFWWGDSKFGEGMRAGVSGDDDETYWVDECDLGDPNTELSEEALKLAQEAKQMGRGDRVRVISGPDQGVVGEIFWWGKSKFGEGMRAGVETDGGEKLWLDASELALADGSEPAGGSSHSGGSGGGGGAISGSFGGDSFGGFDDDEIPF